MTLSDLIQQLTNDTIGISLPLFRPELCLCLSIVVMLLVRVFSFGAKIDVSFVALGGTLMGLWYSLPNQQPLGIEPREELFTGLLVYDSFTVYFRALLMFFAVVFVLFTRLSGIPDREDAPDFFTLVLGGTLGMCLMASANHLLTIFLAVEMASVPSYALAGMLKGRRQSSEAALKYSVYGAGAAGVMLYGISLLAGVLGSCHLPTMAATLADSLGGASGLSGDQQMVLVLGGLMVAVGLAFKLSAVPFHFWCPDVFEGASAEVNAFLSISSKAAALALLVRVAIGFGAVPIDVPTAMRVGEASSGGVFAIADTIDEPAVAAPATRLAPSERTAALAPVRKFMALVVALLAAITCTFGNLAAYGQTNIKRLLAYSTIAHAGYMMMPVAAALVLADVNPAAAEVAIAAIPFYLGMYLFMNLARFAVVAFLRNTLRSERIEDYAGLVRRSPGVVLCMGVVMFSLIGLPPLSGFAAKFVVFASLVDAIRADAAPAAMIALLVIGGLNTAISLFYYVRVVKVMTIDPEPEHRPPAEFPIVSLPGAFLVAVTLPIIGMGVWWGLRDWALKAAEHLLT